jgi:8-hydroxy-5-deazaflavin:NADPH oxidoreductase
VLAAERVERLLEHPEDVDVAIIGGTGALGRGLAGRWADAGHRVFLGSRDARRAAECADSLGRGVVGMTNEDAIQSADVTVIAVPWSAHESTLSAMAKSLTGSLVVDCVNPLGFDENGPFAVTVREGSAAEQAACLLPDSTVVAAFHHVSAELLLDESRRPVDSDVMVLGDDRRSVALTIALAGRIEGVRGVYAGRLRNARQVEALTANLIAVNRRYRCRSGLRVTGLAEDATVD